MHVIEFDRFGDPSTVARVAERPDPQAEPGKVLVRMAAMPINPADLLSIEGRYGVRPDLPAIPGFEGAGRVEAVGDGVEGFAEGDVVVPFGGNCWREKMTARPAALMKLPANTDIEQAAMLKANPATAEAMLTLVDLQAGDWIIQNAANSAVGQNLVLAARDRGLRTVNLVRREGPVAMLKALGADAILVDGGTDPGRLAASVGEITGEARPRLAIDAIGGTATGCLAASVAEAGLVVNYGLLSGEACRIDPFHLVFRDVRVRGFWLSKWFQEEGTDAAPELYRRLAQRLASGALNTPVEARYSFDRIAEALVHAARSGRSGKILIMPTSEGA